MKKYFLLFFLVISVFLASADKADRSDLFEKFLCKANYDQYSPDPEVIEIIRTKVGNVTAIDIYFAYWCSDSETNVPPFIKILDEIGPKEIKVKYFASRRKNPGEKFYCEKLNVTRVPTFIFYKDGKEIGRIVENPKKTLEEDLLEIIF